MWSGPSASSVIFNNAPNEKFEARDLVWTHGVASDIGKESNGRIGSVDKGDKVTGRYRMKFTEGGIRHG